ncbi:hypothetical protein KA047_01885 [Candidatus Saccharibacteria bacterium]|nr:hypothetical protein [Candidatus Saccharibacteria bacterium]
MSITTTRTTEQQSPIGDIFLPEDGLREAQWALDRYQTIGVTATLAEVELAPYVNDIDTIAQNHQSVRSYVSKVSAPHSKRREEIFVKLAGIYAAGLPESEFVVARKAAKDKLQAMYTGKEVTASSNARNRQQVIGMACLMRWLDPSIPGWEIEEPEIPQNLRDSVVRLQNIKHDAALEQDIGGHIQSLAGKFQHELAVKAHGWGFGGWIINGRHYQLEHYPLDNTPYLSCLDEKDGARVHFSVASLFADANNRNATVPDSQRFLEDCIAADKQLRQAQ